MASDTRAATKFRVCNRVCATQAELNLLTRFNRRWVRKNNGCVCLTYSRLLSRTCSAMPVRTFDLVATDSRRDCAMPFSAWDVGTESLIERAALCVACVV